MRGVTLYMSLTPLCGYPFQSTRLMRGVTLYIDKEELRDWIFQSTRLMRGVTAAEGIIYRQFAFQSTRLMRGVTGRQCRFRQNVGYFNPHASCEA